jgi:hypothetical protein
MVCWGAGLGVLYPVVGLTPQITTQAVTKSATTTKAILAMTHYDRTGEEVVDVTVRGEESEVVDLVLRTKDRYQTNWTDLILQRLVGRYQTDRDTISDIDKVHNLISAVLKDAASRESILVLDGVVTDEATIRHMAASGFAPFVVDLLQEDEASKRFGAKGQNGAVVFTTKTRMLEDSSLAPASP